jgi:solute carrier family 25 carnitine/acylcarnitine transporter 20/29
MWFKSYFERRHAATLSESVRNFVSGGAAATVLWTLVYPADVCKNVMMSQPDVTPRRFESLGAVARHGFRSQGLRYFYRGFVPCLARSFPTNGAAFASAEYVLSLFPDE